MKCMNIKRYIGEATEYDKKRSLEVKKPKSWCKSVSAFANTLGGALIFGISDESVKATATEMKRLVLRGRNTSYDSQVSTYKVEDFAFSKLRERYKNGQGTVLTRKILFRWFGK